jgi:hypothetical protein
MIDWTHGEARCVLRQARHIVSLAAIGAHAVTEFSMPEFCVTCVLSIRACCGGIGIN